MSLKDSFIGHSAFIWGVLLLLGAFFLTPYDWKNIVMALGAGMYLVESSEKGGG